MQISWKEDNSDWCKLWKEWKSANSSNLIIYPTARCAISNCQLSNDFLRQNNIAAKKNHFWYSLIAFLLYIGSLSLPCFFFCTLSTCYWIALCQIKDHPRTSIWQIYPTFFFFTKRQDIFTISIGPRWCCCSCWSWCIICLKIVSKCSGTLCCPLFLTRTQMLESDKNLDWCQISMCIKYTCLDSAHLDSKWFWC